MNTPTLRLSRRQALGLAAGTAAGAAGATVLARQLAASVPPSLSSAAGPDGAWSSPLGSARPLAAHLLRRAGFGYTRQELDQAASMPYESLVDQVVSQQPATLPAPANPLSHLSLVREWLGQMATTPAQFPERMTLFWHGLLTSDYHGAGRRPYVLQQNQLYRAQGRSDLRTLLTAATFDPLMMRYLNLAQSTASAPNENYARELMELFSLGPGNYTETDVREGARALSGIRIARQGATFRGVLTPRLHDGGSKTFLGHTGNLGPEQVIDIILAQPACAPFIAHRALVHFCTPSPSPAVIDSVATQFRQSNYDIKTLMRAIFTSGDFKAANNYRSLVRSPVDYMVAAMRVLNRPDYAAKSVAAGRGMDQVLYDMPNVAGWPSNQGWISSGTWLARVNFAAEVVATQKVFPSSSAGLHDQLDGVTGPDTAKALSGAHGDADYWYALLASPEFHLK
jgi:uncharacterized protein (DUF1800 family)